MSANPWDHPEVWWGGETSFLCLLYTHVNLDQMRLVVSLCRNLVTFFSILFVCIALDELNSLQTKRLKVTCLQLLGNYRSLFRSKMFCMSRSWISPTWTSIRDHWCYPETTCSGWLCYVNTDPDEFDSAGQSSFGLTSRGTLWKWQQKSNSLKFHADQEPFDVPCICCIAPSFNIFV